MIYVFCDGASFNGNGGSGFVVFNKKGEILKSWCGKPCFDFPSTNNVAEFYAVLEAIKYSKNSGQKKVQIFTDSDLAVKCLNRKWKIHKAHLKKISQDIWKESEGINVSLHHVYREFNQEADRLSKEALNQCLSCEEKAKMEAFENKLQFFMKKKTKYRKLNGKEIKLPWRTVRGV